MADACHEPEWRVWEDVELPERKVRISRAIGHASDFIAQPERAADRLLRSDSNVG
jgi:5-methyltetrahydropteroyltriglutamate--homocysteine methyltransferase